MEGMPIPEYVKVEYEWENFKEINFKGPPGNTGILDLPCLVGNAEDGAPRIMSFWKPTKDELALLNEGRYVMLSLIGTALPPVSVMVP